MFSERYEAALRLAAVRHKDQQRKDTGVPYVTHLVHVARLVELSGGGEDGAIVALLHDVLEDTAKSPEDFAALANEIGERFGAPVLEAVQALTEPKRGADAKRIPWKDRKRAYLAQLEGASALALLVSNADKLHNLATLNRDLALDGDKVWQRFQAGKDETRWFYASVAELLKRRAPQLPLLPPLFAEIERLDRPQRSQTAT